MHKRFVPVACGMAIVFENGIQRNTFEYLIELSQERIPKVSDSSAFIVAQISLGGKLRGTLMSS